MFLFNTHSTYSQLQNQRLFFKNEKMQATSFLKQKNGFFVKISKSKDNLLCHKNLNLKTGRA